MLNFTILHALAYFDRSCCYLVFKTKVLEPVCISYNAED